MVIIFIAGGSLLILILLLLYLVVAKIRIRIRLQNKLDQVREKMFFNGIIISFKLSLFKYCITAGNQAKLYFVDPRFVTKSGRLTAIILPALLLLIAFASGIFLLSKYNKLGSRKIMKVWQNLYINAPLTRDKLFVLRFPLLIVHRLAFVMLACLLFKKPTLGI